MAEIKKLFQDDQERAQEDLEALRTEICKRCTKSVASCEICQNLARLNRVSKILNEAIDIVNAVLY